MTNLDALFAPENKFVVPVKVSLLPEDQLKLHKFLNLHYISVKNEKSKTKFPAI